MCCPDRKKCHPCHPGGQVIVGQVGLGWPGGTSSSLVSVTPLCQNKQTLATRGEGTPHDSYHNTARANSAQNSLSGVVFVFLYMGGDGGLKRDLQVVKRIWRGKEKRAVALAKTRSGGMVTMCCSIVAFQRAPCIYNETHYCTPAPPSEARGAA